MPLWVALKWVSSQLISAWLDEDQYVSETGWPELAELPVLPDDEHAAAARARRTIPVAACARIRDLGMEQTLRLW
jgi:hypothetical protein